MYTYALETTRLSSEEASPLRIDPYPSAPRFEILPLLWKLLFSEPVPYVGDFHAHCLPFC